MNSKTIFSLSRVDTSDCALIVLLFVDLLLILNFDSFHILSNDVKTTDWKNLSVIECIFNVDIQF